MSIQPFGANGLPWNGQVAVQSDPNQQPAQPPKNKFQLRQEWWETHWNIVGVRNQMSDIQDRIYQAQSTIDTNRRTIGSLTDQRNRLQAQPAPTALPVASTPAMPDALAVNPFAAPSGMQSGKLSDLSSQSGLLQDQSNTKTGEMAELNDQLPALESAQASLLTQSRQLAEQINPRMADQFESIYRSVYVG